MTFLTPSYDEMSRVPKDDHDGLVDEDGGRPAQRVTPHSGP